MSVCLLDKQCCVHGSFCLHIVNHMSYMCGSTVAGAVRGLGYGESWQQDGLGIAEIEDQL